MTCLTLPTSTDCYGFRVALLARYMTAIYDNVLQERNISSARLHVLAITPRPERARIRPINFYDYADEARDILGE